MSKPRCDLCRHGVKERSLRHGGMTTYCRLLDNRDVGQSAFGRNSPKDCPLRTDELISREAAIDALKENMVEMGGDDWCEIGVHKDDIEAIINALPSKNKSGKWIHKTGVYGVVYCSRCDYELHSNNTNFCPTCGARMKGADDE